jgi:hypothetical protein
MPSVMDEDRGEDDEGEELEETLSASQRRLPELDEVIGDLGGARRA